MTQKEHNIRRFLGVVFYKLPNTNEELYLRTYISNVFFLFVSQFFPLNFYIEYMNVFAYIADRYFFFTIKILLFLN